jgi:hypothetical protein
MDKKEIIQYGWLLNNGKIEYIFNRKIMVAMCFMSNVEKLKERDDGKLVKLTITKVEEVD